MIEFKRNKLISYRLQYFATSINILDIVQFTRFERYNGKVSKYLPLIKSSSHTIKINLTQDINKIYDSFKKGTKYDIRRAEKDGVTYITSKNICNFLKMHEDFSESKDRISVKKHDLELFGENYIITLAIKDNHAIAAHYYIIDSNIGNALLLHSASSYRKCNSPTDRALIGRANRGLHFYDIIYFKSENFKLCDLGGYALIKPNQEQIRINKFKEEFNSNIDEEITLTTIPLFIYEYFKSLIKNIIK